MTGFDGSLPLSQARTIPAAWYADEAVARLERERVFGDSWLLAGRADQVTKPGDYFTCDLAGEPVVVARDEGGVLRAFSNVCRHRAARVACAEQGHATKLRCRYHGWTYDLTGRLRGTPEFDGVEGFRREDNGLPAVAVGEWGPLVWVHLGASPPPLGEWLAPLERRGLLGRMAGLEWAGRREYRLGCNWKVFVDNYLDGGYHVNTVHPALAGVLDYAKYRTEVEGHLSVQISPLEAGGVGDVRGGDEAHYAWVFPHAMLNVYDGVMDTNVVLPAGPGACRVVFDFYFAAGRDAAYRARSMEVAHQVQLE
ncbi:MAG: aromatic ring-hydroxylating oxygenase subunit alpha, partial [Gemmataceae bacterium]